MSWSTRKALRLIREYKESRPCVDCKFFFRYFQIELDHVPGRGPKLYVLGSREARYLDEATLRRELAKCDPTCRNCHSFRTWYRLYRPGLRTPVPQPRGRNLPPGASLVPWTKTNVVAPAQGLQDHRANIPQRTLPARNDSSVPQFTRFRG